MATNLVSKMARVSNAELKKMMGPRLKAAAEVIAAVARAKATAIPSKRIPPSIRIMGGTSGVWITAGGPGGQEAPNAYPFEYGVRHPLFGNTKHWYAQPHKPFLEEAADEAADKAAEEFAEVLIDWAKALDLAD